MMNVSDSTLVEKETVFRFVWYAIVRSVALSIFIVACLHSSFSFELKAMIIAAAIFGYIVATTIATLLEAIVAAQSKNVDFLHLTYLAIEAGRLTPDSREPAKLIADRIEGEAARASPQLMGSWPEALSNAATMAALGTALSSLFVIAGWFAWPFFRSAILQWVKFLA